MPVTFLVDSKNAVFLITTGTLPAYCLAELKIGVSHTVL
jgi:hypothetical protein